MKRWLGSILRVKCVNVPSKYLGLELGYLKTKKKLSSNHLWISLTRDQLVRNPNCYHKGRRMTLIKSTITSIPNYSFSCFKALKFICNKFDQTIKGFQQGHEPGATKIHLKNWDSICQTKANGGLRIRKSNKMNQALLRKQACRLITVPNSLMASILLPKYCNRSHFLNTKPKPSDSWNWKSIL